MNKPESEKNDTPAFVDEAEALYVELEGEALDNPNAETVPSGATVRAD